MEYLTILGLQMINNRKYKIVVRYVLAFTAILLVCCSYGKKSPKDSYKEIHQVKVFISFPTINASNKLITIKDSFYINYYKDIVLYKFPYTIEYSNNTFDSNSEIIKQSIIKVDTNFRYLIYRNRELNGIFFDSAQDKKGKRVFVDSFMSTRFLVVESLIYNPNDSFTKKTNASNNVIQETYIRKLKNDKWDCDTNNLFFSSRFNNIDFSFSKKLDSVKGKKLFKVKQISNGDPQSEDFFFRQKREVIMELKETIIVNRKETEALFDRFYKSISQ